MTVTWVPDAPRVFNLGLRSRAVDYEAKTVTLELASDEALLMDYATLVVDTGARAHQASVRAVCNYVLGKIGAALEPGGPDADVTAYWALSNLIEDPTATLAANFFSVAGITGAPTIQTSGGWNGTTFVRFQSNAAGLSLIRAATSENTAPGKEYTLSAYMRASVAALPGRVTMWISNAAGVVVQQYDSPVVPLTTTGWTRVSVSGKVTHPDAVKVQALFYTNATASGQNIDADGLMLTEGLELVPWFIGSQADDAHYAYEFTNAVNDSTSTRTPFVDRPPDLFIWKPGVTAWDFLAPLLTSVGFRLFCDELRAWRLIDPTTYVVPGYLSLSPGNATLGVDTISREDADVFATGVVVEYLWEDASGVSQIAYDTAGTPEKVVVITYRRAFPGPGAAAAILGRRSGTGRVQDVTALAVWSSTPGMQASIALPPALDQLGKVASVRFGLGDDSLMDVGTRELIDIHPGSIDALLGTIDALVGTIDSL